MFDIAIDECGRTCKANELVRDKCAAEIGNTRKRKYFCVACVGEKHPVSLKVRHEVGHIDKKARNYTALAWFSHHGSGGTGNTGQDSPSRETARHWQAKHILSQHVGQYYFTASKCKSCTKHTTVEDGVGAIGKVEFPERTSEEALYSFDAALVRGNPGSVRVSSVLEVWATHKMSKENASTVWTGVICSENLMQRVCSMHIEKTLQKPSMISKISQSVISSAVTVSMQGSRPRFVHKMHDWW